MKKITLWLFFVIVSIGLSIARAETYNLGPEVASTLYAINKAEINTSQIAKNKTINRSILKFADQMIKDHQYADIKLKAILKRNNINNISSANARTIRGNARKTIRQLKKLEGIAFDKTYMKYQIDSHQYALKSINEFILPRVENVELKNYTIEMRKIISRHLQEAQKINKRLIK